MKGLYHDEEPDIVGEHFALVYTPRKKRQRFPENRVRAVASEEDALKGSNAGKCLYPALVFGPSRSSEGLRLYYLARWLA